MRTLDHSSHEDEDRLGPSRAVVAAALAILRSVQKLAGHHQEGSAGTGGPGSHLSNSGRAERKR
jgi:hypothetical protein